MRAAGKTARVNDRTFLWLACIAALCAGFYLACFRLEMLIDRTNNDARQTVATIAADERIVAARPQLEHKVFELDKSLHAVDLHADHPMVVAHFITTCARVAVLHHTHLVQLDEHHADPGLPHDAQVSSDDAAFETIALDVTLSGSYRDLLLTIRDLADAPVATSVNVAALERTGFADINTSQPSLTAHLHVTLSRLISDAFLHSVAVPSEVVHARSF